jgi:hypothetical protein
VRTWIFLISEETENKGKVHTEHNHPKAILNYNRITPDIIDYVRDHVEPTKDGPGTTRRLISMKFKKSFSIFQIIYLYRKLFLRTTFDSQELLRNLRSEYENKNLKFIHEVDEVETSHFFSLNFLLLKFPVTGWQTQVPFCCYRIYAIQLSEIYGYNMH